LGVTVGLGVLVGAAVGVCVIVGSNVGADVIVGVSCFVMDRKVQLCKAIAKTSVMMYFPISVP
jgi:hypothetical protein